MASLKPSNKLQSADNEVDSVGAITRKRRRTVSTAVLVPPSADRSTVQPPDIDHSITENVSKKPRRGRPPKNLSVTLNAQTKPATLKKAKTTTRARTRQKLIVKLTTDNSRSLGEDGRCETHISAQQIQIENLEEKKEDLIDEEIVVLTSSKLTRRSSVNSTKSKI
jgi:hypothetical protein